MINKSGDINFYYNGTSPSCIKFWSDYSASLDLQISYIDAAYCGMALYIGKPDFSGGLWITSSGTCGLEGNVIGIGANFCNTLVLGNAATKLGFFQSGGVTKPTVTGGRGVNAALASLCTQLANLGLITNSTTEW